MNVKILVKFASSLGLLQILLAPSSLFPALIPSGFSCFFFLVCSLQTITRKMVDQGRPGLDVVFTMILCATNVFIW